MRFTVWGAGAIGGTVGAHLARAGEDVRFVDADRVHVEAMKAKGLTIRAPDATWTVPVRATHLDDVERDFRPGELGTVLLAVKSQHTEAAVRRLLPLAGPDTAVVSLQNGLCERTIAEIAGPERTVGAFVDFSADYLEPGLIHYGSVGAFRVGELDGRASDRVRDIVRALGHWGPVQATDNIWGYLWAKMGYANMLFASALVDATMADAVDRNRELMVELACEVYEVAAAEGVRLEPFDAIEPAVLYPPGGRARQSWEAIHRSLDGVVAWQRSSQKQKSGIWRDLAVRRRKTEVDAQIGRVVEIGAGRGLAMPLTRRLVAMIHEIEDGARRMSWANLDELQALRANRPR